MIFTVETYEENDKKYVYIAADDGSSGGEYEYTTPKEFGEAMQFYVETYYESEV